MNDPVQMLKERLALPDTTQTLLADEIGISPQFLSEILNLKRNPSRKVLEFLGLEKVITYRPVPSSPPSAAERRSRNRRRA